MTNPQLLRRVALVGALCVSCTADFSVFDTSGEGVHGAKADASTPPGPDAGAGGASAGGTLGSGGSAGGGAGSGATAAGGSGGIAGSGPSTGGAESGGHDAGASGVADSGSGGVADAGAGSGGAAGSGGMAGSAGCSASQKLCASACVGNDSPATGCAAASCNACSLTNVSGAACSSGVCSVGLCASGFDNCNAMASDGCETDTTTDANCGGCNNRCGMQGGLTCKSSRCSCTSDAQCKQGASQTNLTCDIPTGQCHCSNSVCAHGETCSGNSCSCNGGRACMAGRTCCQTPAGCFDLMTNAGSCGGCGRACPAGFICDAGTCACNGNGDCNAGSPGTCTSGACVCGTTTCPKGQRCLATGVCG